MVPDCFGYFSEYREVTGTPRGKYGPHGPWEGGTPAHKGLARPPQGRRPNWIREGGAAPLSLPEEGKKGGGRILLGLES